MTSPPRPPWETSQWRSFHQPPPEQPKGKSIGPLGVLAIAVGAGFLGYYVLDGHAHTCEACGHRWRHLGAFNFGDPKAHSCDQCGTVQWWKDGLQHVFRDPTYESPPARGVPDPRRQEIRGLPQEEIPSGTYAAGPRGGWR